MKYLIIIIFFPFLIFARNLPLLDSATVIQKAIDKANEDWKSGNAYYSTPNFKSLKCLIDSVTGLRYVEYYSKSNLSRWDYLRKSKYMEELLRLCKTKGLPPNNYLSIRDLICDPETFVMENFDRKVQIKIDEKNEINLNNSIITYSVEFYSTGKYGDIMQLYFYNDPSNTLTLGTVNEGYTIYYISGPENIGYFIILDKKQEINSIQCFDMKKQNFLSRTPDNSLW